MRVLVTGGAGYIGSHTCVQLLEAGHEVAVLDNFQNSQPEALERVQQVSGRGVELHEGDVREPASFESFITGWHPEAVIHFAGLKSVAESVEHPARYYTTNVQGTVNVAEAALAAGATKFVFSSSATVYSPDNEMPVAEDADLGPINPYGWSKLMAEQVLRDMQAASPHLAVAVLRYFNPVGAHDSALIGEDPNGVPANLMPFLARVAEGTYPKLKVFGNDYPTPDGTGVRDYIHVVDLAGAHLVALETLDGGAETVTWNVGRGAGLSVLDMVTTFERVTGKTVLYETVARRVGDVAESYANVARITSSTAWSAVRDPEVMIRDLWRWQCRDR